MKKIAVIGGGLIGIYTAYWANRKGLEVTLFEQNKCLGGQLTQLYPFKEINDLPGRIPIKAKNYVTELKAQLEETNVKVRLNTKINIVYEGSDCVKVESGNAESTSHGSLAFGKGMHRCLGEPLVVKFIKELYPVLLSYSDTLTCISFDTNSEFGFFTFTKLLVKYRGK